MDKAEDWIGYGSVESIPYWGNLDSLITAWEDGLLTFLSLNRTITFELRGKFNKDMLGFWLKNYYKLVNLG